MVCRKQKLFVHPSKWPHPRKCSILLGATRLKEDLGLGCVETSLLKGGNKRLSSQKDPPFLRHWCL